MSFQLDNILSTKEDEEEMRKNFTILMAQTLCDYMPFFRNWEGSTGATHLTKNFCRNVQEIRNCKFAV